MSAPQRMFATVLLAMIGLVALGTVWAQAPKPLGEGDLIKLIDLQLDDAAIVKRIQRGGIDFTADEATLDRLKKAGASEGVLDAVREAAKARPTVPKTAKTVTYEDILTLLRAEVDEQDILDRLARSPTIFTLGAEQVDELKSAGATEKLLAAMQGPRPSAPAGEVTDLAIILDCSGSMAEKTRDGQIKMDVAKRVVSELIHDIPAGLNVAFLIYGHDANLKCQAVKVVRPLGSLDSVGRSLLTNAIRQFRPVGATPIATALGAAGSELAKGRGPAGLVLISDGKETCGGDPTAETARLVKELKLTFGVNVIGFDVQPDERAALEEIARAGRGQYYDAQGAAKFRTVVQAMRKKIDIAAKPAVKKAVAQNGNVRIKADAVTKRAAKPAPRDLSPAVQALVDNLNDKDREVRITAAESLAKLGAKSAVPALMKRLADDFWIGGYSNSADVSGKVAALNALKKLAPERVMEGLLETMTSKNGEIRAWVAGQLGSEGEGLPAVECLSQTLKDEKVAKVREAAAWGLGKLAGRDENKLAADEYQLAIESLVRTLLNDDNGYVRRVAAESLGTLGEKSTVPALIKRVTDDFWVGGYSNSADISGKDAALNALKKLAPEEVPPTLVEATKSKNGEIRTWAAAELGKLAN